MFKSTELRSFKIKLNVYFMEKADFIGKFGLYSEKKFRGKFTPSYITFHIRVCF